MNMNEFYRAPEVVSEYDASRYGGAGGRRSFDIQWQLLRDVLGPVRPGLRVLDVGAGTGAFTAKIRELGAQVTVLDASLTMIHHAKALGRTQLAVSGPAEALPFADNSFDVAVTVNCLNHVEHAAKAVEEMLRVARRVLIAGPNYRSLAVIGRALKAILRRDGSKALAFTTRYENVPPPFSHHLEATEVAAWTESAGAHVTACRTAHALPLIPAVLAPLSGALERAQRLLFPNKGTFLVMAAERR